MIQVVVALQQGGDEIVEDSTKYLNFYENGVQQASRVFFSAEGIEILTGAFRAVGIKVIDLTTPAGVEDETQTDI